MGITLSGSGVGGLVLSNICQAAIDHLAYRWALRICGFVCLFFILIATYLVKQCPAYVAQQQKQQQQQNENGNNDVKPKSMIQTQAALLKNPQFTVLLMVGIVTTFAYLTPAFSYPVSVFSSRKTALRLYLLLTVYFMT